MDRLAELGGNLFVRILLDVPHDKNLARGAMELIDRIQNLFELLGLDEPAHRRHVV